MFNHSRHNTINGGNFVITGGSPAFEKLQKASAPSAFHNSSARFDAPKCHPNTRIAVLEYLMGWIFGHNDREALILWLYGPAGAGKSAILQTVAEHCVEHKALLASFFFARTDPSRNNFKPLIATLAYQITTTIPQIKPYIERAIERDPLLFDKSIDTQLQSLIVRPLKDLAASGYFSHLATWACLILIDGLDECDDPRMQSMILRALANALRNQHLPVIFLIASRPEQNISLTFNSPSLAGLWRSLVLDDTFSPDDDIRLFLMDSFMAIKTTHPHRNYIPDVWPEQSNVEELVRKSSGQFIYASVVIKYVSKDDDLPPRRLEVVRGLRPARCEVPFAELDALYMHILDSCKDPKSILQIIGFVISDFTVLAERIELLLDLEPGEVKIALAPLYSILELRVQSYNQHHVSQISLFHASFGDFLVDVSRSGRFHVDILTVLDNARAICIRKLMQPTSTMAQNMSPDGCDTILSMLGHMLSQSLINRLGLTETTVNILKRFSLPQFCASWSNENCANILRIAREFLSACEVEYTRESTLYEFHLCSLKSLFYSKMIEYCNDEELMSLVVVIMLTDNLEYAERFLFSTNQSTIPKLLWLSQESITFDQYNLQLTRQLHYVYQSKWFAHYPYPWTSTRHSTELALVLDGEKFALTALRILQFLCRYPPHPIPRQNHPRKHHTRKFHPNYGGTLTASAPGQLPSIAPLKKPLTGVHFPRKLREEKHRYGVALSYPTFRDLAEPCQLGLIILPIALGKASNSVELVDFIRTHGKDIVFMPKYTREVIYAMHEYLDSSKPLAPMK